MPRLAVALAALRWVLGAGVLAAVVVGVGALVPTQPLLAGLLIAVVAAFAVTLFDAAIVPLVAMVPLLLQSRLGAGGVDLTVSDLGLFVALWPALFFGRRPYSTAMRNLLWLTVVYQAATLMTVVANPYRANAVEWAHAWLLTGGALVVGWAIGREGHARAAISIVLVGCAVFAVSTIVQGATQYAHGNFAAVYPQWPIYMHKNLVGCVLGFGAVISYARPAWIGWQAKYTVPLFWICVVGIFVAQSRQALVGLAVALIVLVLRTETDRRRSKLILLAALPALSLVWALVRTQAETGNRFNSYFQRISWFHESVSVWQSDPLFGAGLRWWYTDRFPNRFQPPNAILEVLSCAGLVGLVGLVVLAVGTIRVLRQLPPAYGLVASVVFISRLVQGQLDIFWVAVQMSIPFAVIGICLGAAALKEDEEAVPLQLTEVPSPRAQPAPV